MPTGSPAGVPTGIDPRLLFWIGVVCLAVVIVSLLGRRLERAIGGRDPVVVLGALTVGGVYVLVREFGIPEVAVGAPVVVAVAPIVLAAAIVATVRVSRASV